MKLPYGAMEQLLKSGNPKAALLGLRWYRKFMDKMRKLDK
jgi:hypothetical protein